jgi:ankyrin repeat protein
MVLSGRDANGQLFRQAELDTLLASPEGSVACRQVNSGGWTALMLAARNSRFDSTDATVA